MLPSCSKTWSKSPTWNLHHCRVWQRLPILLSHSKTWSQSQTWNHCCQKMWRLMQRLLRIAKATLETEHTADQWFWWQLVVSIFYRPVFNSKKVIDSCVVVRTSPMNTTSRTQLSSVGRDLFAKGGNSVTNSNGSSNNNGCRTIVRDGNLPILCSNDLDPVANKEASKETIMWPSRGWWKDCTKEEEDHQEDCQWEWKNWCGCRQSCVWTTTIKMLTSHRCQPLKRKILSVLHMQGKLIYFGAWRSLQKAIQLGIHSVGNMKEM